MADQHTQEYLLRNELASLQRQVRDETDPDRRKELMQELTAVQEQLLVVQQPKAAGGIPRGESVSDDATAEITSVPSPTRSDEEQVKYDVQVHLHMRVIPTSIYHLFTTDENPLLTVSLTRTSHTKGAVRVIVYVEGYSARAVQTVFLSDRNKPYHVQLLPTLFPDAVRSVHELTRATVNVEIQNLTESRTTEHVTLPIWILPSNSAPLQIQDAQSKQWQDMTRYIGALVTPYDRKVLEFLRTVAEFSPGRKLDGYRGDVDGQVAAVFNALKEKALLLYVDSVQDFNPDSGYNTQRVRLPRETLHERQANCIDGTLLYASLLEAVGINPALIFVPEHVFLGWETAPDSNQWRYVETTWISTSDFAAAVEQATWLQEVYAQQREMLDNPNSLLEWPVRRLRTEFRIWPTA